MNPSKLPEGPRHPQITTAWEKAHFSNQLPEVPVKMDHQDPREAPLFISQGSPQWEIVEGQSPCSEKINHINQ